MRPFTPPAPARALRLAGLAGALVLSACAGASTTLYTLDAATGGAAPAAYAGPRVQVRAVHVPPGLDRVELMRRTGPDTLQVRDNAHWAAPLGQLARRALTQDLAERLPAGAVVFPDAPTAPGSDAREIVVDVLDVETGPGEARMDVSWTILPRPLGPPVAVPAAGRAGAPRVIPAPVTLQHTRTAHLTASGGESDAANAGALSQLLSGLADAIAADLRATPPEA